MPQRLVSLDLDTFGSRPVSRRLCELLNDTGDSRLTRRVSLHIERAGSFIRMAFRVGSPYEQVMALEVFRAHLLSSEPDNIPSSVLSHMRFHIAGMFTAAINAARSERDRMSVPRTPPSQLASSHQEVRAPQPAFAT